MFEALFIRGPKPVSNEKYVNVGLHITFEWVLHVQEIQL